jgi:hypothetical protein
MLKFDYKEKEIMETASVSKVLQLFNMLSKSEQLEIADKIDKQTFKDRWQTIDNSLPEVHISEEDIMQEVRAIRYGRKD